MTDLVTERRFREIERMLDHIKTTDSGIGAGTTFPTGISAGFYFFRTDLGFLCYYDGTRWLTAHEYHIPLLTTNYVQTGTGEVGAAEAAVRTDYSPYFTRYAAQTNPAATNDGSNYWTLKFRVLSTARVAGSTIQTYNTSADAAATVTWRDGAITGTANPASAAVVQLTAQGTGAPGALTVYNASIWYRLVIP